VALHELPLEQRYLHGHFSKDLEPAVEVDPGDSVRFFAPNHAWDVARDEHFEPRSPELDQDTRSPGRFSSAVRRRDRR
jgi:acetamidase/formamidase